MRSKTEGQDYTSDLDSRLERLPLLLLSRHSLLAHDATTPVSPMLVMLVIVALLDRADELAQLRLVLATHLRQRQHGRSLLVDDGAEARLALDDRVGDAHLAAERGQEDNELDRVDVIGDEDEGGFLVLDERDDVIEAVFHGEGLLGGIFFLLALLDGRGFLEQALFLLGFGLRAVFVQELEGLRGGVAVEGVLELGDCGWDFEAHVEDLLLALEADVLWPFYHAREVALGLDVLADAEVAGALLEEGVLCLSALMSVAMGCQV